MNIKISGASGYLGKQITATLRVKGHTVERIDRTILYGRTELLAAALKATDAVIHLAGSPLLVRWTNKNKKEIIDSRVVTGQNIARAIKSLPSQLRPAKVISASGVSIYATGRYHTDNSSDYDKGFLSEVVRKWEQAWEVLPQNVNLTIFRMAAVIGKESPTINTMLLPFKLGVGGKVGSGRQPFPFVHDADVVRAYIWAVENQFTGGTYILAAPHQISNATFTKAFAKALHRPAFMKISPAALKIIYGKSSEMIFESPSVHPDKLLKKGFIFQHPTIESAMKAIFK